jgi:hypothetical protein
MAKDNLLIYIDGNSYSCGHKSKRLTLSQTGDFILGVGNSVTKSVTTIASG